VILLLAQPELDGDELITTLAVRKHPVKGEGAFCCEQINLTARGLAVQKLPYVVWSLAVGDLPIKLWWATNVPPPLGGETFHELAENAEQVVFDSLGWRDPPRGMAAVAAWIQDLERTPTSQRWRLAADLNWRRLKYWRRLLTQALDPATAPGFLDSINDVVLEHGPHAVIQAWELLSWLAARLGWQVQTGRVQPGVEMDWVFQAKQGPVRVRIVRLEDCRPALCRVRIAGPHKALSFTIGSERRLAVFEEGTRSAPRTLTVQPQTLADMVGREFSDRERDPVFRASLQIARELAQSVLH
jgi:glucose-6-phosphate dehydrogenase assembly protein OpcA